MSPSITSSRYILQAWTTSDPTPLFRPFHSKIAVITQSKFDQTQDIHISLKDSIVVIASPLQSQKRITIEGKVVILSGYLTASTIEVIATRALLYRGEDSLIADEVSLNFSLTRPGSSHEFSFRKREVAAIRESAFSLIRGALNQNRDHDLEKGLTGLFNATLIQKKETPKDRFDSEVADFYKMPGVRVFVPRS